VYEAVEIVLVYFADSMIRRSKLSCAAQWNDLAAERGQMAGDEDFFDRLDATLRESTDEATERLGVFYTCVGLGFTGWYAGQPEVLRKKMLEMSSRLRGQTDADRSARICPEAYESVNTSDLVEPPARRMVGVGIVLVGLAITLIGANIALYVDKQARLKDAVNGIVQRQAGMSGASGTSGAAGGAR
jgi:type VI protein secretion system component VasF